MVSAWAGWASGASSTARSFTKCGSTSYSICTAAAASRATSSEVAATATISSWAHWISVPTSWMTWTLTTPSIASAADVSMAVMRAWACGHWTMIAQSIPRRFMS